MSTAGPGTRLGPQRTGHGPGAATRGRQGRGRAPSSVRAPAVWKRRGAASAHRAAGPARRGAWEAVRDGGRSPCHRALRTRRPARRVPGGAAGTVTTECCGLGTVSARPTDPRLAAGVAAAPAGCHLRRGSMRGRAPGPWMRKPAARPGGLTGRGREVAGRRRRPAASLACAVVPRGSLDQAADEGPWRVGLRVVGC